MRYFLGIVLLILAACAPQSASTPTSVPHTDTPEPTDTVEVTTQPTAQAEVASTTDTPAWQQIELTNARTGETFTLADFAGKTVYVEPMATWCPNCRTQQSNVVLTFAELGSSEDYVFLSLSVGESIQDSDLAAYADREGFDWDFAIASADMLSALVDEFGYAAVSPPLTPHFTIWPDGTFTTLTTGYESGSTLLAALTEAKS